MSDGSGVSCTRLHSGLAAGHAWAPLCKLASSQPASLSPHLPSRAAKALEGALAEIKMDQFPSFVHFASLQAHAQLPLHQYTFCRAAKALEGALAEIKMDQFPRCPTRAVCGAYIALQASCQ